MEAWELFLTRLEEHLSKQSVERFLRSLKIANFDACNLYLEAEDSFQIDWFEEHVRKIALKEFLNNNGHLIRVHFTNQAGKKEKKAETPSPAFEIPIHSDPLDPSYSFDNFIYDAKNGLVVDFLKQLSSSIYNPLFLHGDHGTGKTHLLMATAQMLAARNLRVFYVHAETFTEHVVAAIRNSQMQRFRSIYRNQDVLIIEDVHLLARRNATQEELFHTFNALHTQGKLILLSSHLPPDQMSDIEPRLTSRFEWGISLHLHPLAANDLPLLLKNRAKQHQYPLNDEVIHLLIQTFGRATALMRSFDALLLRHRDPHTLTPDLVKKLLEDLIQEVKKEEITADRILNSTSIYFGISPQEILGKSQSKEVALPRKIAMYLCRQKLNLSYLALGRFFDRDHSTVMTSIKSIEDKKASPEIGLALESISKKL